MKYKGRRKIRTIVIISYSVYSKSVSYYYPGI